MKPAPEHSSNLTMVLPTKSHKRLLKIIFYHQLCDLLLADTLLRLVNTNYEPLLNMYLVRLASTSSFLRIFANRQTDTKNHSLLCVQGKD